MTSAYSPTNDVVNTASQPETFEVSQFFIIIPWRGDMVDGNSLLPEEEALPVERAR